jgi:hypothetical protein
VLDHGRIVESGTPHELAKVSKLYRAAAKTQTPDEESLRILGLGSEVAV